MGSSGCEPNFRKRSHLAVNKNLEEPGSAETDQALRRTRPCPHARDNERAGSFHLPGPEVYSFPSLSSAWPAEFEADILGPSRRGPSLFLLSFSHSVLLPAACAHVCLHAHMYVYTCVHACVCLCACSVVHTRMCVCLCVRTCKQGAHACTQHLFAHACV